MDINYLIFLQNFREGTGNVFSPFLLWITKFAVGFWPIAMASMIYWVFDRKSGKKIIAGFGLGVLMNGFLKLTFRITRPWIRDSRVLPYGDSKVSATGYSFPSGHTTFATGLFIGTSLWQRKRNKILSIILLVVAIIIMFSRNYLGVHTPQDVFVGCISTLFMMFIAGKIEDWTDEDIKRDWIVMAVGLIICGVLFLYYNNMVINPLYDEAGTLIVDPIAIKADSFEGIGFISSYVICRYFERRYFHFDSELDIKDRFIVCVIALIPLYWWINNIYSLCAPFSLALGRFATHSGNMIYTFIIVPLMMKKIKLPKWMKE